MIRTVACRGHRGPMDRPLPVTRVAKARAEVLRGIKAEAKVAPRIATPARDPGNAGKGENGRKEAICFSFCPLNLFCFSYLYHIFRIF